MKVPISESLGKKRNLLDHLGGCLHEFTREIQKDLGLSGLWRTPPYRTEGSLDLL